MVVIALVSQLMELFQLGGWRLTKFVSNSRAVMDSIPKEHNFESLVLFEDGDYGFTQALGIGWDMKGDYFKFQLNELHLESTSVTTKRYIWLLFSICYTHENSLTRIVAAESFMG